MENKFYFTKHALIEMSNDNISMNDVKQIAVTGEIIKTYPEDKKGLSQLMLGFEATQAREPIHVVCAYHPEAIHIITAYRPNPELWNNDFKTRKTTTT